MVLIPCFLLLTACHPSINQADLQPSSRDRHIAALAHELNDAQLRLSRAIEGRARSQDVESLAQRLTARHTGFQRELHQVGIPPAENALARELGEDVDQLVTAIDRASALAVDREYLSATITLHVAAVELLDESMIFQAERDALGAVLQNMHSEMELNLQEAERLRMRVW